jgi:hypothetical protein
MESGVSGDLIESVQINKTLQANHDGDAISGTAHLATNKAGDRPTLSVYRLAGSTRHHQHRSSVRARIDLETALEAP